MPNLQRIVLKGCLSFIHPLTISKSLISLNMKDCRNLKFFLSSIQMESLESLNLFGCEKLEALPEIQGNMELLSELLLGCTAIRELPSSIGRLFGISLLDLRTCKNLVGLPDSVSKMRKLKVLILKGCLNLATFPENLGDLEGLEELYAGNTAIRRLPDSMIKSEFARDMIFPCAFDGLKELKSLDLSGCILSGDKSFACIYLTTLVELNLSRNKFVSLPDSISQLYRLRYLNITHCHQLKKLPQSIKELYAEDFLAIQSTLALLIYRRLYLVSFPNYSFNQQSYTEKSNDMLPQDWYDHTFIKAKLICNNHSEELQVLEKECKVSTTSRSYSWCVCFAYIPFHTLQQMSDTEVRDFNQYGLFEASIQRKNYKTMGSSFDLQV